MKSIEMSMKSIARVVTVGSTGLRCIEIQNGGLHPRPTEKETAGVENLQSLSSG